MRANPAQMGGSELGPITGEASRSNAFSVAALVAFICFITLSPLTNSGIELSDSSGAVEEGNILRQIGYFFTYFLALAGARVIRFPQKLLNFPLSIAITFAWCCLSILWATHPAIGIRRLLLTIVVASNIFLLVRQNGYQTTVVVIRVILFAILIANYVAVFGWPLWAIHQDGATGDENLGGSWRGILMHKNNAGSLCAFTIFYFLLDVKKLNVIVRLGVVLAAGYFLYRTNSKTSLSLTIMCVLTAGIFARYNPYYKVLAAFFLGVIFFLFLLASFIALDSILIGFDDPDTLTGRVQIWLPLLEYSLDHLWLGSGFGSFWDVGYPNTIAPYVQNSSAWVTSLATAHNGYLDMLIQTGIPGLILAVLATVVAPFRKLISSVQLSPSERALLLACILFAICHNFTESDLFQRDAIAHVYMLFAIALLYLQTSARSTDISNQTHLEDRV